MTKYVNKYDENTSRAYKYNHNNQFHWEWMNRITRQNRFWFSAKSFIIIEILKLYVFDGLIIILHLQSARREMKFGNEGFRCLYCFFSYFLSWPERVVEIRWNRNKMEQTYNIFGIILFPSDNFIQRYVCSTTSWLEWKYRMIFSSFAM